MARININSRNTTESLNYVTRTNAKYHITNVRLIRMCYLRIFLVVRLTVIYHYINLDFVSSRFRL